MGKESDSLRKCRSRALRSAALGTSCRSRCSRPAESCGRPAQHNSTIHSPVSAMPAESDRRLAAVLMVVLWVLAEAVPAAAAPLTSADDLATSSSTGATTPSTDQQLLDSLPEEERVAVMAYELAAALQRLAEQVAAGGEDDVTEQARIVERGDGEEAAAAGPAMLHRALHAASAARTISLSQKFHSILNRWALATSNATDYKVMKVRAKITICFPFNVCFQIEDPWSLCCPF